MANWTTLKAAIADAIKTNGNQEITGQLLQNVLNNIVSSVGENSTFAGIATPATNPGALDGPVFYLATEAGIYANFGGVTLTEGLNILLWNGSIWSADNLTKSLLNNINSNTGVSEYPVFSDQTAYKAGDVVNYMGKLYQFTSDHAAGAWIGTDVEKTDVVETHIVQELGDSENLTVSQKAITDAINKVNGVAFTQNKFLNSLIKELYTGVVDVSTVTRVEVWKAGVYKDVYVSGLQFYAGDTVITGGNAAKQFATLEEALDFCKPVITSLDGFYYVCDWDIVEQGHHMSYTTPVSSLCNSLDASPSIKMKLGNSEDFGTVGDEVDKLLDYTTNKLLTEQITVTTIQQPLGLHVQKGLVYYIREISNIDTNHNIYIIGTTTNSLFLKNGMGGYYVPDVDGELGVYNAVGNGNNVIQLEVTRINRELSDNPLLNTIIQELYAPNADFSNVQKVRIWKCGSYNNNYITGVQVYDKENNVVANIAAQKSYEESQLDTDGRILNINGMYVLVNWKLHSNAEGLQYTDYPVTFLNGCQVLDKNPAINAYIHAKELDEFKEQYQSDNTQVKVSEVSEMTANHARLGIYLKRGQAYKVVEESNIETPHSFYIYGTELNSISMYNGEEGIFIPDVDGEAALFIAADKEGKWAKLTVTKLEYEEDDLLANCPLGINNVGFIQKENIDACDYCYIPVYGQSFTNANDGQYKLTEEFDSNCFMVGSKSTTWAEGNITPLSTGDNVELIHTVAADVISRLYKKYAHKAQNFLVGSYGKGNRTILELMKNNGLADEHTYEEQFMPGVTAAKNAVQAEGKTFNCPCILYMQGESDVGTGYVNGCKGDKNLYKTRFLQMKADMQQTIMEATGQANPPSVMVYVVGGPAFNDDYMGIAQAVNELARENKDVISIGPYYQVPDFKYHPTPDGRRWLGEIFAKVYYENFIQGINNTMDVDSALLVGDKIYLRLKNVVPPLQVDTMIVPEKDHYGFRVKQAAFIKTSGRSYQFTDAEYHTTVISTLSVEAGNTYTIALRDAVGSCNVFVYGDIDNFISLTNGQEKSFTPVNSGNIAIYPTDSGGLTGNMTIYDTRPPIDIKSVSFKGNLITIELTDIYISDYGTCTLTYGNIKDGGEGNIKDSEEWMSYYTYVSNSQGTSKNALTYEPKWKDGTTMIGHNYDMHKWLPNFGITVQRILK